MIAIINPIAISATDVNSGAASKGNLLTAPPREVWATGSISVLAIDVDLGSAQTFDTIYLGNHNLPADATWTFGPSTGLGTGVSWETSGSVRLPGSTGPRYQTVITRTATSAARFFRIYIAFSSAQVCEIGVLAVGQALRHSYAYSSGRQLIDTTRRTDLFDGGFGVDHGAVKAAFKWRFVDLDPSTRDLLWSLAVNRGIARPVIVIEDGASLPPPEASVHYGLFDKFEAWERANPADTVWSLSMTEWR